MENLFYASPDDFHASQSVEIKGQEAQHISRVLRHGVGDEIYVADGKGKVYTCTISGIAKNLVTASIKNVDRRDEPVLKKVLALGVIKKRDRLEFAVEKAVELGAWEICLFKADHSERSKINKDRIRSLVVSAFKQSKRYWLPTVTYLDSLDEVFDHYPDFNPFMAHMQADHSKQHQPLSTPALLLVGPEGGFSNREVNLAKTKKAEMIFLGENRLRAETADLALLAKFL